VDRDRSSTHVQEKDDVNPTREWGLKLHFWLKERIEKAIDRMWDAMHERRYGNLVATLRSRSRVLF
jgi:hypothetical protein